MRILKLLLNIEDLFKTFIHIQHVYKNIEENNLEKKLKV